MQFKLTLTFLLSLLVACAPAAALPPPASDVALRHTDDVRAVIQASGDSWRDGVSAALFYADKMGQAYVDRGVPLDDQHLVLVFHGHAGYHLLNDAAFAREEGRRDPAQTENPNAALVTRLTEKGVRVELCSSTMRQHGWTADDLLPEVIVVPNAYPRVIDLQMDGYAHLVFD